MSVSEWVMMDQLTDREPLTDVNHAVTGMEKQELDEEQQGGPAGRAVTFDDVLDEMKQSAYVSQFRRAYETSMMLRKGLGKELGTVRGRRKNKLVPEDAERVAIDLMMEMKSVGGEGPYETARTSDPSMLAMESLRLQELQIDEELGLSAGLDVSRRVDYAASAAAARAVMDDLLVGQDTAASSLLFTFMLDEVKVRHGLYPSSGNVIGMASSALPEGGIKVTTMEDVAAVYSHALEEGALAEFALVILIAPWSRRVEGFPPIPVTVLLTTGRELGHQITEWVEGMRAALYAQGIAVVGVVSDHAGPFRAMHNETNTPPFTGASGDGSLGLDFEDNGQPLGGRWVEEVLDLLDAAEDAGSLTEEGREELLGRIVDVFDEGTGTGEEETVLETRLETGVGMDIEGGEGASVGYNPEDLRALGGAWEALSALHGGRGSDESTRLFFSAGYDIAHLATRLARAVCASGLQLGLGDVTAGQHTLMQTLGIASAPRSEYETSLQPLGILLNDAERAGADELPWITTRASRDDILRTDPMCVSGAMALFSLATSVALAQAVNLQGESLIPPRAARLMLKYLQVCRRFLLAFTSPLQSYELKERIKDVGWAVATIRGFSREATARKRRDTLLPMPCLAGIEKDASQLLNRWMSTLMWDLLNAREQHDSWEGDWVVEFSPWATTSQPAESLFREWRTRGKTGTSAADIDIPNVQPLVRSSIIRRIRRIRLNLRTHRRRKVLIDGGVATLNAASLRVHLRADSRASAVGEGILMVVEGWRAGVALGVTEFDAFVEGVGEEAMGSTIKKITTFNPVSATVNEIRGWVQQVYEDDSQNMPNIPTSWRKAQVVQRAMQACEGRAPSLRAFLSQRREAQSAVRIPAFIQSAEVGNVMMTRKQISAAFRAIRRTLPKQVSGLRRENRVKQSASLADVSTILGDDIRGGLRAILQGEFGSGDRSFTLRPSLVTAGDMVALASDQSRGFLVAHVVDIAGGRKGNSGRRVADRTSSAILGVRPLVVSGRRSGRQRGTEDTTYEYRSGVLVSEREWPVKAVLASLTPRWRSGDRGDVFVVAPDDRAAIQELYQRLYQSGPGEEQEAQQGAEGASEPRRRPRTTRGTRETTYGEEEAFADLEERTRRAMELSRRDVRGRGSQRSS